MCDAVQVCFGLFWVLLVFGISAFQCQVRCAALTSVVLIGLVGYDGAMSECMYHLHCMMRPR